MKYTKIIVKEVLNFVGIRENNSTPFLLFVWKF